MAKNNNLTDFLTELADVIRNKFGYAGTINPQDFYSWFNKGSLNTLAYRIADGSVQDITALEIYGSTKIRDYVFRDCDSLKRIVLPDTVKSIGQYAFYGCNELTSITIPNSVTTIGQSAFQYCSKLTSVTFPSSIKSIAANTLRNCSSLASVNIPNSVTAINTSALRDCSKLQTVNIGSGVTTIGTYALRAGSSSNKTTFTIRATTPPTIQSNTFNSSYINKIYVPTASVSAYKSATNWSSLSSYIYDGGF